MVTESSFVDFASSVGYAYSHIMRGVKSLAILSSYPFTVVKSVKDQFDYGYIHVKVNDINFIVYFYYLLIIILIYISIECSSK